MGHRAVSALILIFAVGCSGEGVVSGDTPASSTTAALSPAVSKLDPTEYAQPGIHEVTLDVDGASRTYELLVPSSYDGTNPVPLVLAFHGYTMNPSQMVHGAWGLLAEEQGFVLAAPLGLDNQWAVAHDDTEAQSALPRSEVDLATFPVGDRDVAFAGAVLADVGEYLLVAPGQVYVTGVSLGGFMASRVACDLGEYFAGLGPTLNSLLYSQPCSTSRHLAVISVGHELDTTHSVEDARTAAAAWARHNGCDTETQEESIDKITRTDFSCAVGDAVTMVVHDYGWSGDSAERVIWEFFQNLL